MVDDLEIWRASNTLIKRYGLDGGIEAAKRVDAMLEAGDPEGLAVWKRILRAVDELLAKEPPRGMRLQ